MAISGHDNCKHWRELIARLGSGELLSAHEAALRAHLSACVACAREAAAHEELQAVLRRDPLPLAEINLPSGEQIARSIVEAEALRSGWSLRLTLGWSGAVLAVIAAVALGVRQPQRSSGPETPAMSPVAQQPAAGFWIVDDERTGRDVVVGPAVSIAGTP